MNDNHIRVLQVRLLLIERNLHEVMSKLEYDTDNSFYILYSFKNNIAADRRNRILDTINSMINEINKIKTTFALVSKEISVIKSVTGNLDEIWTTLENTRPEKISLGYGGMTIIDEELLRPGIIRLVRLLENVYTELEYARFGI
ncbi:MAG TPA: hypothetical protein VIY08_10820 [Candidatus Nitrosocosmicus sp.]